MLHTSPIAPDLRSACDYSVRVPSVANDPWQNKLLAALPPADRERLPPELQSIALLPGGPSTAPVKGSLTSISRPRASSPGSM